MLDDGTYDAIVVDATDRAGNMILDLAVLAGAHKGEVVTLSAAGLNRDAFELLAMPATLSVVDGEPSVQLES